MATKTISIDTEAYDRLVRVRKDNESFSQAIKRVVPPPLDVEAYIEKLRALRPLGDEAIDAIEEQIEGRRRRSRGRD